MNTTITQLRSTLVSILAAHPIYGADHTAEYLARNLDYDFGTRAIGIGLRWERAWGVGASLGIRIEREKGDKAGYGGRVPCVRFRTGCDIGWSATGRDVKSATAALALYRQVVDLAALIEAATDGLEEKVEKPAAVSTEEVAK
jgi:hypothetical protein